MVVQRHVNVRASVIILRGKSEDHLMGATKAQDQSRLA